MDEAVAAYHEHRSSDGAWALGRFVVPAKRLGEFVRAAERVGSPATPWPLSALLDEPFDEQISTVSDHQARHSDRWHIESVEARVSATDEIRRVASSLSEQLEVFFEVSPDQDLESLLREIHAVKGKAKLRTGGVTAAAFPSPDLVLRFMKGCRDAGVAFKATAGLHHALCGDYPLTYEPDSARTAMFGFINLVMAAAALLQGTPDDVVLAMLREREAASVDVRSDGIAWQTSYIPLPMIALARSRFVLSIGSCSFREPLDELTRLARG